MEDGITWVQWTTWIVQAVTILGVVLSWWIVPLVTERRRKEAEIGIWQHTAMSDAHRNLATALYELEQYFNELISLYSCEADDLTSRMTDEERHKANRLVQQMNTELAIMHMVMPDSKYEVIRDRIDPEQPATLRDQRENLLVAMRKAQFPRTEFGELEDIRFFHGFKRPDKEPENQ